MYIVKWLTWNLTTKSYKIDTEKLGTWPPPTKIVSMYQTIWIIHISLSMWMNPIEITLNRPGYNKTHSRADIRCKWTPLSLQGDHFITTIFWIPDKSPLQVRLGVEKPLAIILNPITIRTEEFANFFVTLIIFRTLDNRENHSLDDLLDYMDKNLGRCNEVSHIKILHALVDLFDIWT